MKRLYHILLSMEPSNSTYSEMYNGKLIFPPFDAPLIDYDPRYFAGDLGFYITGTHKLAKDKPTVTLSIPIARLGLDKIPEQQAAAADHCLRALAPYIDELNAELYNRSRPDNENGKYYLCRPGGEILVRNTAFFDLCPQRDYEYAGGQRARYIDDGVARTPLECLCIRMQVQLPKKKHKKAAKMLCKELPHAVNSFLEEFDREAMERTLTLAEQQRAIRAFLRESDYCAFIANGSILPRSKGTDEPMEDAVPFLSPAGDEIEVAGVRGMGVKRGVMVITGGGYSGKSTLLDAISAGIYDHTLGDGRELCITDRSAVSIAAEDGRSVKHVNISPFIKWLPGGDTADFSTERASGSTSQAANIMEAVDSGAKLLLIDEDRSATNFMIRDRMMKALIEKEPITPFTDRVNELHQTRGVSTILVIGGSGEYLSVADRIYMMEDYLIRDVTEKAKTICASQSVANTLPAPANWQQRRTLYNDRFSSYPEGSGSERLEVTDLGYILIGDEQIDVRGLYDIVSERQLDTLGFMLRWLEVSNNDRKIDIEKRIDELYARIEEEGLDFLYSTYFTTGKRFLDLPRRLELTALINRMRKINLVKEVD